MKNIAYRMHCLWNQIANTFRRKTSSSLTIDEALTFEENCTKNRVLYRSQPYELEQLFQQLGGVYRNSFWAKAGNAKRISAHTYSLPSLIADKFAQMAADAYTETKFSDAAAEDIWEDIEKSAELKEAIRDAVTAAAVDGDGGFVVSFSPLSPVPSVSFVSGTECRPHYAAGRFVGADVFSPMKSENMTGYVLKTSYGLGTVSYELYTEGGTQVPLSALPETAGLMPVQFISSADTTGNAVPETSICLFVPFRIRKSRQFAGRGASLFDGKETAFDAVDEAWSQWLRALRNSASQQYIPASLIPKDADGKPLYPDGFENTWIACGRQSAADGADAGQITVANPAMNAVEYETTLRAAVQTALTGLMSPSTLGIDTRVASVQANSAYNSQIEKTTMNTRSVIVDALQKALSALARSTVMAVCSMQNIAVPADLTCTADFSEFESPSFDEVSSTCNACVAAGTMSRYTAIKRCNPAFTDDEIDKELERIKDDRAVQGAGDAGDPFGLGAFGSQVKAGGEPDAQDKTDDAQDKTDTEKDTETEKDA